MKKLLILFLIFCATLTNAQEKGYWVCFNVEVDADGAGDFVQSLDNFMNSDTAKQLPFVITLMKLCLQMKITRLLINFVSLLKMQMQWLIGGLDHLQLQKELFYK